MAYKRKYTIINRIYKKKLYPWFNRNIKKTESFYLKLFPAVNSMDIITFEELTTLIASMPLMSYPAGHSAHDRHPDR